MTRAYRIIVPLLGTWLAAWIWLSWAAIQDDALIHLRYADNLFLHHFITYDGVHADYGASSLLYVALLAVLRSVTTSPNLPRAVSSVVHGLLFIGLASALIVRLPKELKVARLAGLVLLVLLVTPSAVRWLDDGMETGIVVSVVSLLAWVIHDRAENIAASRGSYLLVLLAFLAVLLRTELVLLCVFGCVMLAVSGGAASDAPIRSRLRSGLPLIIGAGLAVCFIFATMRVLLPDTAVAKSHGLGHWFNPLHDTAVTLGGALSFGVGSFAFWLITLRLVATHHGRLGLSTALANAFFPVELTLACLRGQEIQGVRYFAWTFFFPIVWNLLELARPAEASAHLIRYGRIVLFVFLALIAIDLPFEVFAIRRVLTGRARTTRSFEAHRLDVLRDSRGIASDIGYIGYFTQARICDLAGLVNGLPAARRSSLERALACVNTDADFIFGNISQLVPLTRMKNVSEWKVCGRYDFTNVSTSDVHYLVVRPDIAAAACAATSSLPEPIGSILPPPALNPH